MISSAKAHDGLFSSQAHDGLFSSLLNVVIPPRPVSPLGGRGQLSERSLVELTAHLPPHMVVDIGLSDPRTAERGAGSSASQPVIPPVAAMHRRGDWGGHSLYLTPENAGDDPVGRPWIWPLRVI